MARKRTRTNIRTPVAPSINTFTNRGRALYAACAAASLVLLGLVAFFPVQSDDIFMYLAIARRVMREGTFPPVDPFLFSIPNYHWHILHEWGSHLLAYAVFSLAGWTGLIVAKLALILLSAAIALLLARRLQVRSP